MLSSSTECKNETCLNIQSLKACQEKHFLRCRYVATRVHWLAERAFLGGLFIDLKINK